MKIFDDDKIVGVFELVWWSILVVCVFYVIFLLK